MSLLDELRAYPALDQHAHNLNHPHKAPPWLASFSESDDPTVWERDTPHSLFFRRSLKRLANLLGCAPTGAEVWEARQALGLEGLTRLCLEAAHLQGILLDDGLTPEALLPWTWHQQFVSTRRIVRLEALAQELLAEHPDFADFEAALEQSLDELGPEVVGLKSIAAYRGGLHLPVVSREQAAADYSRARRQPRWEAGPAYHYLLHQALALASQKGLPVQFHTGFGDPDLDLAQANPLWLRPLLQRYSCPLVILHAGYPYFREAGYLASTYARAWVDFGLAIPYLSLSGMQSTLAGLLELAPLNKVLYSSDASLVPELYYLGATHAREILAQVLGDMQKRQELSAGECLEAGRWILADNACQLYGSPDSHNKK